MSGGGNPALFLAVARNAEMHAKLAAAFNLTSMTVQRR